MDYKNKIPWFERDKDIFKKTSNHHAYIFEGPKGIGKNLFTLEVAKGFLCTAKPNIEICNECKSCHLFDESNHPDFYPIKTIEDKKQISINQIREIQEPLYESSFMGSKKVFLINPLEKLTREAFDSFLKNLEEPPSNSVFLLVSHRYQTLPLTIKSRCIQISMLIPEKKQIEIWLENQTKHKEKIESAILFSKGKPLVAAEMINLEVNVTRKDFIKDISHDYLAWVDRYKLPEEEDKKRRTEIAAVIERTNEWIAKVPQTFKAVDVVMNDGLQKMAEATAGKPIPHKGPKV